MRSRRPMNASRGIFRLSAVSSAATASRSSRRVFLEQVYLLLLRERHLVNRPHVSHKPLFPTRFETRLASASGLQSVTQRVDIRQSLPPDSPARTAARRRIPVRRPDS